MSESKKPQRISEPAFYHTTIKSWPEGERPREKMNSLGSAALSEAELLAILIRTGNRGTTAVDLARKLLANGTTLRDIAQMDVPRLKELGIGEARAAAIVAAFELGRRTNQLGDSTRPQLQTPEDVANIFGPKLRDLKHEEFWVLLLNSSNRLMDSKMITKGTLNSSLVHPRESFHDAVKSKAASVIFVHNHPSGNSEPSQEDISMTKQLVESGKVLGIPVHDHVIVSGSSFTSFAERRLI